MWRWARTGSRSTAPSGSPTPPRARVRGGPLRHGRERERPQRTAAAPVRLAGRRHAGPDRALSRLRAGRSRMPLPPVPRPAWKRESGKEAPAVGLADRGGPVPHPQLVVDVQQVRLYRGLADEQRGRRLTSGHAVRDEAEHLELSLAQAVLRRPAHPGQHAASDRGREHGLSSGSGSDGPDQLLSRGVLEQVAGRPGLDGGKHVVVRVVRGQDQNLRRRRGLAQPAGRLDPTHLRHAQVHEDDVGPQPPGLGECLSTVSRLTDDLEALVPGEDPAQAAAHHRVIVYDQQPDRRRVPHAPASLTIAGTRALMAVPEPGTLSTSSWPPTCRSRWAMAWSPNRWPPWEALALSIRVPSKPTPSSRTSRSTTSSM